MINEQGYKQSFTDCPLDCPWYGKCLNGTKFDNGEGGCNPSSLAYWFDFSHYSPCFRIGVRGVSPLTH